MDMQACPLGSLPAGIKEKRGQGRDLTLQKGTGNRIENEKGNHQWK